MFCTVRFIILLNYKKKKRLAKEMTPLTVFRGKQVKA